MNEVKMKLPPSTFKSSSRSKTVVLYAPTKNQYEETLRKAEYNRNKSELYDSLLPFIRAVEKGLIVKWTVKETDTDTPTLIKEAPKYVTVVLEKKSQALKNQLAKLYAVIYYSDNNLLEVLKSLITEKSMELAREIVERGAMDIQDVCSFLSWPAPRNTSWYSVDDVFKRNWISSVLTMPLSLITTLIRGASDPRTNKSRYSSTYYVIPSAALITLVLENSETVLVDVDEDTIPKEDKKFGGTDFANQAVLLEQLITSKTITTGKTKLPVSSIKKVSKYMYLNQFPNYEDTENMSRDEYLLTLAFLNFGGLRSQYLHLSQALEGNGTFIKHMAEQLNFNRTHTLCERILQPYVRGIDQSFYYYYTSTRLSLLYLGIQIGFVGSSIDSTKWLKYESLYWKATKYLATLGVSYVFPDTYYANPDRVYYAKGGSMPMSDFKAYINDVLYEQIIMGLAAIGAVDVAINPQGHISHVRLTDIGRYVFGWDKKFPENLGKDNNQKEAFEIDDATGNILVKDKDSSMVEMLPDFAAKIRDNRYVLSAKIFCKGCENKITLQAKIDRFKTFICPNPGPQTEAFFDELISRCDVVKKTPGGTTYTLVSVDKKNRELQELIATNTSIRKNSMMVEGCRLLVKDKFLDEFLNILRSNGFICTL